MNILKEIEKGPLTTYHVDFLIRAVEQLVKYIVAMRKTAPYQSVQRRLLEQVLDPDIRELVESK